MSWINFSGDYFWRTMSTTLDRHIEEEWKLNNLLKVYVWPLLRKKVTKGLVGLLGIHIHFMAHSTKWGAGNLTNNLLTSELMFPLPPMLLHIRKRTLHGRWTWDIRCRNQLSKHSKRQNICICEKHRTWEKYSN